MQDPFHDGERQMQERAGEREMALRVGGMLGDAVPQRAIPFLAEQRMLAVGTVDAAGAPTASLLLGARGLAMADDDGRAVSIDRRRLLGEDAPWALDRDVGLLAIDLATRRRLRVNGVVRALDGARVEIEVRQSYPNCPKYIQRRELRADRGPRLGARGLALVERADTLFVASRHPTAGVDVSHRGGAPGFVRRLGRARLRIPDYRGNGMFNTLGNFLVDPRAGLVVPDFERGVLLQMSGTATVGLEGGRHWDFEVLDWRELAIPPGLGWELIDFSPHNPAVLE